MGSLVMIFFLSFFGLYKEFYTHTNTQKHTHTMSEIVEARGLLQTWDVIITQDRVIVEPKC